MLVEWPWHWPARFTMHMSVAILAQDGIQAPWLEFRLHLPSRQPHQGSFRVRFLFAVYIAWSLLLVVLLSSVENLVVPDLVRSLWWNMGMQRGRNQPRSGHVGKHSRGRTSLSQTCYLPKVRGKRETGVVIPAETSLLPCQLCAGFVEWFSHARCRFPLVSTFQASVS